MKKDSGNSGVVRNFASFHNFPSFNAIFWKINLENGSIHKL